MILQAFTARMGSRDPDWLDITLAGNAKRVTPAEPRGHRGMGAVFAPTLGLLRGYLSAKDRGTFTAEQWERYRLQYTAEMRESHSFERPAWDQLLALPRVVLLCFCTDPERCHRTVLAREILPKLGAAYCGEIVKETHGTKH